MLRMFVFPKRMLYVTLVVVVVVDVVVVVLHITPLWFQNISKQSKSTHWGGLMPPLFGLV